MSSGWRRSDIAIVRTNARRAGQSIALSPHATILPMSAFRLPQVPRVDESEWLDLGRGSDADVAANLEEMWRLNRWLGGMSALTRHLYPRLLASQGPCTVLDLGTGSAQMPRAIAGWARAQRATVSVYGLDWAARNLVVAHP